MACYFNDVKNAVIFLNDKIKFDNLGTCLRLLIINSNKFYVFPCDFKIYCPLNPIVVYYSKINTETEVSQTFQELYREIPQKLWNHILSYKYNRERQLRLAGKLLLLQMMRYFDLAGLTLNDLQFSGENKPSFPGSDFNFSLAHSENISICAGTMNANIGIDIEYIKPVNTALVKDCLNAGELKLPEENAVSYSSFYKIWTKKEAVLKAASRGLDETLLQTINTLEEPVAFGNEKYCTRYIDVDEKYIACIASDKTVNAPVLIKKMTTLE